jgi:hypothetical protein
MKIIGFDVIDEGVYGGVGDAPLLRHSHQCLDRHFLLDGFPHAAKSLVVGNISNHPHLE